MDNLIGTIVFLLPGLLLYFWLQSFGINPVVRHNPSEFTAYVVLLWFPVSMITLLTFDLFVFIVKLFTTEHYLILSIDDLKSATNDFRFIISYILLSIIVSYFVGVLWALWGNKFLREVLINKIRIKRNIEVFSEHPAVWDEAFINSNAQVVAIGRIDKNETPIIGCMRKASRPFEPERHLFLDDIVFFTDLVERHKVSISHVFYDVKSGSYVKIYDAEEIRIAQEKDNEKLLTSSSDQE